MVSEPSTKPKAIPIASIFASGGKLDWFGEPFVLEGGSETTPPCCCFAFASPAK